MGTAVVFRTDADDPKSPHCGTEKMVSVGCDVVVGERGRFSKGRKT